MDTQAHSGDPWHKWDFLERGGLGGGELDRMLEDADPYFGRLDCFADGVVSEISTLVKQAMTRGVDLGSFSHRVGNIDQSVTSPVSHGLVGQGVALQAQHMTFGQ